MGVCSIILGNSALSAVATEIDNGVIQDVSSQAILDQDEVVVYSSLEEWDASGETPDVVIIQNNATGTGDFNAMYLGGRAEYRYVDTKYSPDTRVGYHPDFPGWNYVDAYWFSSSAKTTYSPSISLTWGARLTVGLSVAKGGGTGFVRNANGSRRSRPWVRADITTKRYDMYLYDELGRLTNIYRNNRNVSTTKDIQIFVDYQ